MKSYPIRAGGGREIILFCMTPPNLQSPFTRIKKQNGCEHKSGGGGNPHQKITARSPKGSYNPIGH